MSYTCTLKEQSAHPTLAQRTRTPIQHLPDVLKRVYGAIYQHLLERGEQPVGPAYVAYFNMDMQDLDIEAGLVVARPLASQGDFVASEIPAGRVATCLYVGPYHEIGTAYETLQHMMRDQGLAATGVAYELYLNDPATTPPAALQTEIVFPLKEVALQKEADVA